MKKNKGVWLGFLILFLLSGVSFAECLIIVNQSVQEASLSLNDVRQIYLGKKIKWNDDQKIQAFRLIQSETHDVFLDKYMAKTKASYSAYLRTMISSGTGIPPKALNTEAEVVKYVSEKPGAIGYISSDTLHEGVKVLKVE